MRPRITLVLPALLGLLACDQAARNIYEQQLFAFGTLVELTLVGVPDHRARTAVQQVDAMYQRQHRDWHAWQRGKLLELNEAIAEDRSVQTDPAIVELIRLGRQFEQISQGLFNPSIGTLLNIWGFQQDTRPPGPPPPDEAIQAWLRASPSMRDLQLTGLQVRSSNPAVQLDFGGFAKGYSVGKAVQLIEQKGIHDLIVNAGGDLCVRGKRGRRPWRIGIRQPGQSDVMASIELQGAACVFTSGDYERFFEFEGRRYHHILDPGTGYPAQHTRSVTVIARDPALADAAATALFVAGPERWQEIAATMGVDDVLLLDDRNTAYLTPGLAKRLRFEQRPAALKVMPLSHRQN